MVIPALAASTKPPLSVWPCGTPFGNAQEGPDRLQRMVAVTLGKPSVPYTTSASVLIKQRNSNATVNQPIDTPNPSFHAFLFCFNKIKSLLLPKHLLVVGPASVASAPLFSGAWAGSIVNLSVVTMRLSCTGMALDLRHCRDPTFTGRGHCWDCLSIPGTLTLTLDCVVDYERGLTTDFRVWNTNRPYTL